MKFSAFGADVHPGDSFDCRNHRFYKRDSAASPNNKKIPVSSAYVTINNRNNYVEPHKSLLTLFQSQNQENNYPNSIDLVKLFLFNRQKAVAFAEFFISTADQYYIFKHEVLTEVVNMEKCAADHVSKVHYGNIGFIKITPRTSMTDKQVHEIQRYLSEKKNAKGPQILEECQIDTWVNYKTFQKHKSFEEALNHIKSFQKNVAIYFEVDVKIFKNDKLQQFQLNDNFHYKQLWKIIYGLEVCINSLNNLSIILKSGKPATSDLPTKDSLQLLDAIKTHPFSNIQDFDALVSQTFHYSRLLFHFQTLLYDELREWYRNDACYPFKFTDETYFITLFHELNGFIQHLNLKTVDGMFVHYATTVNQISLLLRFQQTFISHDDQHIATLCRLKKGSFIANVSKKLRYALSLENYDVAKFFNESALLYSNRTLYRIGLIRTHACSNTCLDSTKKLEMECPFHGKHSRYWFCEKCGGPIYAPDAVVKIAICKNCGSSYLTKCSFMCFDEKNPIDHFAPLHIETTSTALGNSVKQHTIKSTIIPSTPRSTTPKPNLDNKNSESNVIVATAPVASTLQNARVQQNTSPRARSQSKAHSLAKEEESHKESETSLLSVSSRSQKSEDTKSFNISKPIFSNGRPMSEHSDRFPANKIENRANSQPHPTFYQWQRQQSSFRSNQRQRKIQAPPTHTAQPHDASDNQHHVAQQMPIIRSTLPAVEKQYQHPQQNHSLDKKFDKSQQNSPSGYPPMLPSCEPPNVDDTNSRKKQQSPNANYRGSSTQHALQRQINSGVQPYKKMEIRPGFGNEVKPISQTIQSNIEQRIPVIPTIERELEINGAMNGATKQDPEPPQGNPKTHPSKRKTYIDPNLTSTVINQEVREGKRSRVTEKETQYNVLIMGQSGVGKSTLLNAIKNYLVYTSAEQALDAEFEYMIATKFDVYDEDTYEPITVCIGNEDNEVFRGEHEAGSRTQSCKEHKMTYTPPGKESMTINFIDTPGLTDTRGGDQDAINLRKIYTKLRSDVKDLHAICLVLKPNESVLTRSLETAILELLSIFPNEAMPNLVFFMTYAHGTFFRPGDTMTPLDAMRENLRESRGLDLPKLSKDTFFCVDNETFRYLCARHQNIPYTSEGLEDYLYSWQESRAAVLRFMDWLRKKRKKPFKINDLLPLSQN